MYITEVVFKRINGIPQDRDIRFWSTAEEANRYAHEMSLRAAVSVVTVR